MNIFDASSFMPRFMCIHRDWNLAILYAIPNIGIWLGYSIGFTYVWILLSKKTAYKNLNFLPTLFLLMAGFFFFCGGTHFNDVIAMIWPAYWFFVIWEWIQFIIVLFTLTYIIQIIKKYVS